MKYIVPDASCHARPFEIVTSSTTSSGFTPAPNRYNAPAPSFVGMCIVPA
jgi:hypothetical protein